MPWRNREHSATPKPTILCISKQQNHRGGKCRARNYSREGLGSRDMSKPWKSSLSWRGRNLRIQTSCHNIQIKHCLRQLLCDQREVLTHSRLLLVTEVSDTVAQLKPVKQNKSWLCQACTLQSTAAMTITEDSAHAAGIHLKVMTDEACTLQQVNPESLKIQREKNEEKVQLNYHNEESCGSV